MSSSGFRRIFGLVAFAAIFVAPAAPNAVAQRLPLGLGLPSLPVGPVIQGTTGIVNRTTGDLGSTVSGVTRDVVGRPHIGSRTFEKDPNGARVVRSEILALSPNEQSFLAAQNLKFQILRMDKLESLGLTVAVLQVPDDMSVTDALAALRKADPAGAYDYNHIYDPSAAAAANASADVDSTSRPAASAAKIGMIDGGLDRKHRVFSNAKIVAKNLATTGDSVATAHGTEVASLLVGDDDEFHGALKGATLYAADVYGGQASGGAADDIARALAWLAANDVSVANVSLAGPPNAVLQAAVQAFMKRGAVLVAAVGNDGPAAQAEYPAAYPGVVGVTSVDAEHKIQIDANRGPDVMFAAMGVDVRVATPNNEFAKVTGTSFAAPVVAARFAILMPKMDAATALKARATLEHAALRLSATGKDATFGYGFLGRPGEIPVTASTH